MVRGFEEKKTVKLGKAKLDLEFLSTCKKRLVIPRFLWFKVANRRLRTSSAYRQCQNKLLQDEINAKHARIRVLSAQVTTAHSRLASLISNIDFIHLKNVSDRENSKKLNQHQRVQDRKIFCLCLGQKDSNSINPDDEVFNFSTRLISDKEKEILSKGLNFAIPPIKLNLCSFLTPFEKFYHQLKQEPININSGFFPESIKAKLKDIAYSGFRSYSRPNALYSQEELNILKDLRNDSNIVIMKPDKGNGVVTLDKHDYNKKMDEILSDTSKFELLNDDAIKITLKRENQVKALLKKLKANNCINERTYNELYPTGTRIGILYGLPKIHKFSIPLRPILSSINHYSYKIAKFFIPFLTPISTSSLVIKDSFSFVQELLNSDINSDSVVMASFDVTSLFTNIPVDETIEIISNQVFANCMYFEGFDRSQFTKLLSLAVKNCHFTFSDRIYQQIDGVAMGSPLGPLFANIFMSFHEKSWLYNCPSAFKPLVYRRYVDDCFLLFKSSDHVPLFLNYLNHQHPNISFTSELEKDGKLPFLDVEISRSNGKFSTSVYRKPTFTGLFTHFHSFIPLAYKRSLVSCLLHRIFNLCSNYENFHVQLEVVRKLFNLNGFPTHMLINLFVVFLTISSNPNPLFTLLLRKRSISVSLSLAHTPFKFTPKLPDFATLLIPILTFDLSFVPLHASPLSFLLRIKFPNF